MTKKVAENDLKKLIEEVLKEEQRYLKSKTSLKQVTQILEIR